MPVGGKGVISFIYFLQGVVWDPPRPWKNTKITRKGVDKDKGGEIKMQVRDKQSYMAHLLVESPIIKGPNEVCDRTICYRDFHYLLLF